MEIKIAYQRDGLTIRGHAYGANRKGMHAVILSHGFLANEKMCTQYAKVLADLGFLAVTFDFCGGGIKCSSDGRTQDMTVLSEKEDLRAVIKGVREQFLPADISLMGCSQGGFVSGLLAKELGSQQIKQLIMFYPAVCIPDDARKGKMMVYQFDPENIPEMLGRFPMKLGGNYAKTVIDMDPFEEMKGYEGPVLLVHGTDDRIVDISYGRRLKEIYPDIRYQEIEGADHGFRGKDDELVCSYIAEFMKPLLLD